MRSALAALLVFLLVAPSAAAFLFEDEQPRLKTSHGNKCRADSDCAPRRCCHATTCVVQHKAPVCTGIKCTKECRPGTLDCAQAHCACVRKRCIALSGPPVIGAK